MNKSALYSPKVRKTRWKIAATSATVTLAIAVASPAVAIPSPNRPQFPSTIVLPNDAVAGDVGFQPEGIALRGTTAYVGSFADGTVVEVNLRTGESEVLVAAEGDPALGVEVTSRFVLVAGAASGEIRVYERRSGAEVAVFDVTDTGLVNDVAVVRNTAYFTDSNRAVLYALPLGGRDVGEPSEIPLVGEFQLAPAAPDIFNSNGIAVLHRNTVVIAQTNDPDGGGSRLYTVDVETGNASRIDLSGGDVNGADGVAISGRDLSVVQFSSDSVAQFRLSRDGSSAEFIRTLTDDALAVPTSAEYGPRGALYVINARFGTPPSDSIPYAVTRLDPSRR